MPNALRILVADDNEMVRKGLCFVLNSRSGWGICGVALDGPDAVRKTLELKPDVVLLDISMPGLNGFEAAERIHEQVPDAEILIVTEHDSRTVGLLPQQPGIRGYVMKSRIERDLIPAVEAASKHQSIARSTAT